MSQRPRRKKTGSKGRRRADRSRSPAAPPSYSDVMNEKPDEYFDEDEPFLDPGFQQASRSGTGRLANTLLVAALVLFLVTVATAVAWQGVVRSSEASCTGRVEVFDQVTTRDMDKVGGNCNEFLIKGGKGWRLRRCDELEGGVCTRYCYAVVCRECDRDSSVGDLHITGVNETLSDICFESCASYDDTVSPLQTEATCQQDNSSPRYQDVDAYPYSSAGADALLGFTIFFAMGFVGVVIVYFNKSQDNQAASRYASAQSNVDDYFMQKAELPSAPPDAPAIAAAPSAPPLASAGGAREMSPVNTNALRFNGADEVFRPLPGQREAFGTALPTRAQRAEMRAVLAANPQRIDTQDWSKADNVGWTIFVVVFVSAVLASLGYLFIEACDIAAPGMGGVTQFFTAFGLLFVAVVGAAWIASNVQTYREAFYHNNPLIKDARTRARYMAEKRNVEFVEEPAVTPGRAPVLVVVAAFGYDFVILVLASMAFFEQGSCRRETGLVSGTTLVMAVLWLGVLVHQLVKGTFHQFVLGVKNPVYYVIMWIVMILVFILAICSNSGGTGSGEDCGGKLDCTKAEDSLRPDRYDMHGNKRELPPVKTSNCVVM